MASVAIDLGATSGRVVLGKCTGDGMQMSEIHRFQNNIIKVNGRSYWDLLGLWHEILTGLHKASMSGEKIESVGVDTWGVDFVLLGKDGHFLSQPRSYRDSYTCGVPEKFFHKIPKETLYKKTGIQIMDFNTVFQLYAMQQEGNSSLSAADKLLFVPDAITWMLSGNQVCEYTILSTSALMNPETHDFDDDVLSAAGLSRDLFGKIVMPGEIVGMLTDEVSAETGLGKIPVIAVAGHDTGSAVAAVPATDDHFAYLSSGTWSLMGVEVPSPIVTEKSFEMNFTNEGGAEGNIRFLKNITGMWLLERCRAAWEKEGRKYTYPQIASMMEDVEPFRCFIDPDDTAFANPDDILFGAWRDSAFRRCGVHPLHLRIAGIEIPLGTQTFAGTFRKGNRTSACNRRRLSQCRAGSDDCGFIGDSCDCRTCRSHHRREPDGAVRGFGFC